MKCVYFPAILGRNGECDREEDGQRLTRQIKDSPFWAVNSHLPAGKGFQKKSEKHVFILFLKNVQPAFQPKLHFGEMHLKTSEAFCVGMFSSSPTAPAFAPPGHLVVLK